MEESKQSRNGNNFTINELFEAMVKLYVGQMKRKNFSESDAMHIYQLAIGQIRKRIEEEPENSEYCAKMCEVADKFYGLVTDPKVIDEITSKRMGASEFMQLYRSSILGDEQRKYDMSDLFRRDYVVDADNEQSGEMGKRILYMPKTGAEHRYVDDDGKRISIEEIGRLYMGEWNGIRRDIPRYRVQREFDNNQYLTDYVYSNIRISDMDDEDYRRAVLQELLGDNNITLSNTGGYVGEIADMPEEMKNEAVGTQLELDGEYFYKVNDKYALRYDGVDLSAVMLHKQYKDLQKNDKVVSIEGRLAAKGRGHNADGSRR